MSEQDNVAVISEIYDAFGRGDAQAILDRVDEKADWVNHGPASVPYTGDRKGHSQVLEFFQAIDQSTTGGKVVASSYIAQGDVVVALGRYSAIVRSTGAQIDTPIAHVFTLREGKVVRWEGFSDSAHVAAAHTGSAAAAH